MIMSNRICLHAGHPALRGFSRPHRGYGPAGPAAMASLRLVSLGEANDGVTIFFLQKTDDPFSRRPLETDDLFSYRLVTTPPPPTKPSFSRVI